MLAAARAAGEALLLHHARREAVDIRRKAAGEFVTEADTLAESLLRERLLQPGDGWLGEEGGPAGARHARRRWIVDPLDGTTNFLHGLGHWAVSIALEEDGAIIAGVIHDPLAGKTFRAETGGGAWLDGAPISAAPTRDLDAALFATGVPFGEMPWLGDALADIGRLMPRCAGLRRMGAAALDMANVAAGRLDGYWERRLQPWDFAAGVVIVREAGGVVAPICAGDDLLAEGSVIAAAPGVFAPFAAIIRADSAAGADTALPPGGRGLSS
ncbi:inositol monophosphatase [Rhodobacteraceae bacterium WD3A24]|nr:inositol monophosphatase [Rhodobacteraceae bacterium WD3A24]